jgi:sensor domain CHASE-containing protein
MLQFATLFAMTVDDKVNIIIWLCIAILILIVLFGIRGWRP